MRGYYWGYAPHDLGFPWGFTVLGILVLAAIIVTIILLLRKKNKPEDRPSFEGKQKAFEILAERFARGEIDAEALKLMKEAIEKTFPR